LPFELTDEEGKFLVELARNAVKQYLTNGRRVQPPADTPKKFFECCGVFVTINSVEYGKPELRGCIGYPYPTNPLVEAVVDSAIQAATGDPRFPSMSTKELPHILFEVSVLTPPELIAASNPKEYVSKFKVGEHGLIVERGAFKGLLLPQVPIEWGWCEEEFLCQCCMKAGLPPDTWITKGTRIYKFKGIIFEEQTPCGAVKRKTLKES
jgi:uncharacterized protein